MEEEQEERERGAQSRGGPLRRVGTAGRPVPTAPLSSGPWRPPDPAGALVCPLAAPMSSPNDPLRAGKLTPRRRALTWSGDRGPGDLESTLEGATGPWDSGRARLAGTAAVPPASL